MQAAIYQLLALSGEVDRKHRIAVHARMWCIHIYVSIYLYVLFAHNPGFMEDFTHSTGGLYLKPTKL